MKTVFRKRWYFFVPLIVLAAIGFGLATMHLWNWLMPALFHLPEITFWQTIGLMVLSRLILGFGGHHGRAHHHCRQHLHEKWENMTSEERAQFKERIHSHRPPWICRDREEKE